MVVKLGSPVPLGEGQEPGSPLPLGEGQGVRAYGAAAESVQYEYSTFRRVSIQVKG